MLIGYARTSTRDGKSGFESQIIQLHNEGCTKIFKDIASSVGEREQLENAISFAKSGDVLMVCKLDRLARNTKHLLDISQRLEWKGVTLRILNVGLDTSTETGKFMLTMVVALAQFERTMLAEKENDATEYSQQSVKYRNRQINHHLAAREKSSTRHSK